MQWKGSHFIENTVKRGAKFKMSITLFRVCLTILCSRIGTLRTRKRPAPPPPPWGNNWSNNRFNYGQFYSTTVSGLLRHHMLSVWGKLVLCLSNIYHQQMQTFSYSSTFGCMQKLTFMTKVGIHFGHV